MSRMVDLSVRGQVDADSLVRYMLDTDDYGPLTPPLVRAEIDLATDSRSMTAPVVIYSCGPPEQYTRRVRAWHWRFSLTLTVISGHAKTAFDMASRINRNVAAWPWRDTEYAPARVAWVEDNTGFARLAPGEVTNSKTAHVFVSNKTIRAAAKGDA